MIRDSKYKKPYNTSNIDKALKAKKITPFFIFDRSEIYSFGRLIKSMGFYPKILPLNVVTDHSGPNYNPSPYPYELQNYGSDFLTHSELKAKIFSQKTQAKGYVIENPFYWYFKRNEIFFTNLNESFITFFPVHTLPRNNFEIPYLINETIDKIRNSYSLDNFRVCLHYHDIKIGLHKYYIENGIDVVSAGNSLDDHFVDRFLTILFTSKLILSNHIGTIFFYSSLFRRDFKLSFDENIIFQSDIEQNLYYEIQKIQDIENRDYRILEFHKLHKIVWDSEKCISRYQLAKVLYKNLFNLKSICAKISSFKNE